MNAARAKELLRREGVLLESAHGAVGNLAEAIAGEKIRGSWWGHPKGRAIFAALSALQDDPDVLVCRLVGGKLTYVHRRLWPALVRCADRIGKDRLAFERSEHTARGHHEKRVTPFPDWVPAEVHAEAEGIAQADAERALARWL